MDILCFSSSDWEGNWGSRQQVMQRFAQRGYRVIFVEQLAGLEHFWRYQDLRRRRWHLRGKMVRKAQPNLWLCTPPPLLPGRYYLPAITHLNAAIVCRWIRPYLHRLEVTKPILWLYKPEHVSLMGRIENCLAVYHCIDEFAAGQRGYKRTTITALENELLRKADVVFANSTLTYESKRKVNSNTYHIPSGVDVEHFSRAASSATPVHPDIATLPRPILAFLGNINDKIDVELLANIAANRPDWSLALIGQIYPQASDLHRLQALPNVHWLGHRPFNTLPSLLAGVDVCLLPYVQGEATRYRSPLKLYEYLATGKPIVSTNHPEVSEFSQIVTIVSSNTFTEGVESVLQGDTEEDQERRLDLAKQHSWDVRVDRMQAVLAKHLGV